MPRHYRTLKTLGPDGTPLPDAPERVARATRRHQCRTDFNLYETDDSPDGLAEFNRTTPIVNLPQFQRWRDVITAYTWEQPQSRHDRVPRNAPEAVVKAVSGLLHNHENYLDDRRRFYEQGYTELAMEVFAFTDAMKNAFSRYSTPVNPRLLAQSIMNGFCHATPDAAWFLCQFVMEHPSHRSQHGAEIISLLFETEDTNLIYAAAGALGSEARRYPIVTNSLDAPSMLSKAASTPDRAVAIFDALLETNAQPDSRQAQTLLHWTTAIRETFGESHPDIVQAFTGQFTGAAAADIATHEERLAARLAYWRDNGIRPARQTQALHPKPG